MSNDLEEAIPDWLFEEHLEFTALHNPTTEKPLCLEILIDARQSDDRAVVLTLGTLLASTAGSASIQLLASAEHDHLALKAWVDNRPRVAFIDSIDAFLAAPADLKLICPAGVLFGAFSVEAAVEAHRSTRCELLRVAVDGASRSVELWKASVLKGASAGKAEGIVRERGRERWVSGSSLGVRSIGKPLIPQHLKKGSAGRMESRIVVMDATQNAVAEDFLAQVRRLERNVASLERRNWSLQTQAVRAASSTAVIRSVLRRSKVLQLLVRRLRARK
ncbi:hypothetical protein BJ994_001716 [Arthrobacter pigmenti]|uniref:Uncharacterized protein n=1 Tax=Arthrobacter pigmenti TaxID=271432 RepID=A0A846RLY7_9MICC|nr:hypothetical protein [Arthrobacter pigmenti]NJC22640.1 hypothetical protein [Arthrobacter pigmenti]